MLAGVAVGKPRMAARSISSSGETLAAWEGAATTAGFGAAGDERGSSALRGPMEQRRTSTTTLSRILFIDISFH
jgi:hypothetical protein